MKKVLIPLLIAIVIVSACKKETPKTPSDVYIAGTVNIDGKWIATYWKNYKPIYLSAFNSDAFGNSIFIYNNDIYVAGYEIISGGNSIAVYWKNGTKISLTNGDNNAIANAIVVKNGDVYVAGTEYQGTKNIPKYWKNGVATLLESTSKNADITDIDVENNNVYVTGRVYNLTTTYIANYWYNTVVSNITAGTNKAFLQTVKRINNAVYVGGQEDGKARYWFNNTWFTLSTNGDVRDIFNGQYMCGTSHNYATYWKSGVENHITNGNNFANALSIFVLEDDIHICGYENDLINAAQPFYYLNGYKYALPDSTANIGYANSIYVVKQ